MGCKLPNSISPEELLTCTTFQHENSSNNEKDVDNSADEYCEPPLKNKSKRQHSEEDNNLNETVPYEPPVKKTKTETANKLNKKNLKHKKTTESPIETKSKTAKISSSIKENTDNLPTEKLSDKSDENNECPAKKKVIIISKVTD